MSRAARPGTKLLALAGLAAVALALSACAGAPATRPPDAAALRDSTDPYIVLAVTNDPGSAPVHPGSTARSYSGASAYAVSDGARRALRALAAQYHLQQISAWPIPVLHLQCAVFALPAGVARDDVLKTLQTDRRVALAEPLQSYSVQTMGDSTGDPYAGVQSGNERMDVAQAHRLSRGHGVRIALIDTGLDSAHPELQGRVDIQRNFVDNDAKQFQLDRHGTAVAGVIAADGDNGKGIAGIAPEARLLALKACWQLAADRDDARCNSFTLAQALASAIELKAGIINLSLTGPPDPLLAALAEQASRAGIIIVGAAAPLATSVASPSQLAAFPGSVAHVIGVARSEDQTVPPGALQAPGREVLTLAPGGRYDFSSGSSISTGEITGVTALLLARESGLDAAHVRALLIEATETVTTQSGVTTRTVNACRALMRLTSSGACTDATREAASTATSARASAAAGAAPSSTADTATN